MIMAPARKRNVSLGKTSDERVKVAKINLNSKVGSILQNRKHANDVFDILEFLQVNIRNHTPV